MARIHTHYDNLKVARNAPPEVIRAAYKTLSQKYHPDRNPGNAEAERIMVIINSSYSVLSDTDKRYAYDLWLAQQEQIAAQTLNTNEPHQSTFNPEPYTKTISSISFKSVIGHVFAEDADPQGKATKIFWLAAVTSGLLVFFTSIASDKDKWDFVSSAFLAAFSALMIGFVFYVVASLILSVTKLVQAVIAASREKQINKDPSTPATDKPSDMSLAGPWRRFFARHIDLFVIGYLTSFLLAYALSMLSAGFALWIQKPGSEYAFALLTVPLVLAIEGGIFGLFGTTLGKGLLGIKVTTASAQRPAASQYFHRLIGVYWYGLGMSFPLVNLITMARQHGRLKAGKQTSYDEGRFNVIATKLGLFRLIAAVVVLVALLSTNAIIMNMGRGFERSYYSGSTWTNEITGRTVSIPRGWIYEKQQNDAHQPVHMFSGPDAGVYVVFAKEDVHPLLELSDYANAWILAMNGSMHLTRYGQPEFVVNGRPALRIAGSMADDRSQRVHATLVKNGNHVWRVVLVGMSGRDPSIPEVLRLQEILFASLDMGTFNHLVPGRDMHYEVGVSPPSQEHHPRSYLSTDPQAGLAVPIAPQEHHPSYAPDMPLAPADAPAPPR